MAENQSSKVSPQLAKDQSKAAKDNKVKFLERVMQDPQKFATETMQLRSESGMPKIGGSFLGVAIKAMQDSGLTNDQIVGLFTQEEQLEEQLETAVGRGDKEATEQIKNELVKMKTDKDMRSKVNPRARGNVEMLDQKRTQDPASRKKLEEQQGKPKPQRVSKTNLNGEIVDSLAVKLQSYREDSLV